MVISTNENTSSVRSTEEDDSSELIAFVDFKDHDGWTALRDACGNGWLEDVQYWVDQGGDAVNVKDKDEWTPLHFASDSGRFEVVEYLVGVEGVAMDEKDKCKATALHYACRNGNVKVVKYLMDHGSTAVKDRDIDGWTPLHYACAFRHLEVIKYLVEEKAVELNSKDDDDTPLHVACQNPQVAVVEYLVNSGAEVNAKNKGGSTALHVACKNPKVALVEYLVNSGAEVNAKNNDGRTALHVACQKDHLVLVKFLIEQGHADVNCKDNKGCTPLDLAREEKKTNCVLYLTFHLGMMSYGSSITNVLNHENGPAALPKVYIESLPKEQEIGKGAFGTVYKVKDQFFDRYFALKQIVWKTPSTKERLQKSFETEIEVLSRFRHPNIIQLLGYCEGPTNCTKGTHFLLLEYAENGSLAICLAKSPTRLSRKLRLRILLDVIKALHYLHSGGGMNDEEQLPCYHRDLKSYNICLTQSFTAKLIDCGLGKLVDHNNRPAMSIIHDSGLRFVGTDGYICPFYTLNSVSFEAAFDIYSFGIIVMEMITGALQKGCSKKLNGRSFGEFRTRYVEDHYRNKIRYGKKKLVQDADPAAGWRDDDILNSLAQLAIQCCQFDKDARPKAPKLIDKLSDLIQSDEFGTPLTPDYELKLIPEAEMDSQVLDDIKDAFDSFYPQMAVKYNPNAEASVTVRIHDFEGAGYKDAQGVHISTSHVRTAPLDAGGLCVHLLMYVVQNGWVNTPFWLITGFADYVRFESQMDVLKKNTWSIPDGYQKGTNYDNGYGTAASFLRFLSASNLLNVATLVGKFCDGTYSDKVWVDMTGVTLDKLWERYASETG